MRVAIVGSGLVGTVAAVAFAKRGFEVNVYEGRIDPRSADYKQEKDDKSFNVGLSRRGEQALKFVDDDLLQAIYRDAQPVAGRMIHLPKFVITDRIGHDSQRFYTVNRRVLWTNLLNEAEVAGVKLHFGWKLRYTNLKESPPSAVFELQTGKLETVHADLWVGADGAHSAFRMQLSRYVTMDFSQSYLPDKFFNFNISIDPDYPPVLSPEHLHIWPKQKFGIIAVPNPHGKGFAIGLSLPDELISFLDSDKDAIVKLFQQAAPEVLRLAGTEALTTAWRQQPRGTISTVRCSPIQYAGKAVLIGDAAHAMTPFYGQGMNAGFEDVRILFERLEENRGDIEKTLAQFSKERPQDTSAIAELSLQNFRNSKKFWFGARLAVDKMLNRLLGKRAWQLTADALVYDAMTPYSTVYSRQQRQDAIIRTLGILTVGGALWLSYSKLRRRICF